MNIKVSGAGCMNCKTLHGIVKEIPESEKIEAEPEFITDITASLVM